MSAASAKPFDTVVIFGSEVIIDNARKTIKTKPLFKALFPIRNSFSGKTPLLQRMDVPDRHVNTKAGAFMEA